MEASWLLRSEKCSTPVNYTEPLKIPARIIERHTDNATGHRHQGKLRDKGINSGKLFWQVR
jgi:hypothetical protein